MGHQCPQLLLAVAQVEVFRDANEKPLFLGREAGFMFMYLVALLCLGIRQLRELIRTGRGRRIQAEQPFVQQVS